MLCHTKGILVSINKERELDKSLTGIDKKQSTGQNTECIGKFLLYYHFMCKRNKDSLNARQKLHNARVT